LELFGFVLLVVFVGVVWLLVLVEAELPPEVVGDVSLPILDAVVSLKVIVENKSLLVLVEVESLLVLVGDVSLLLLVGFVLLVVIVGVGSLLVLGKVEVIVGVVLLRLLM